MRLFVYISVFIAFSVMASSIITNILKWRVFILPLDVSYLLCSIAFAFLLFYKIKGVKKVESSKVSKEYKDILDL